MPRHPLAVVLAALSLCALPDLAIGQTPTTGKKTEPTGRLGFDLHEGEAPPTGPAPITMKGDASAPDLRPEEAGLAIGVVIAIIAAGLFFTFIPFFIAIVRGHRSALAIGLVCFFFGWTGIGWLIALVWSFADTGRRY